MRIVISEFISLDGVVQAPGGKDDHQVQLVDEVRLGGGKGIFPTDGAARRFERVSATTATTGVQVCRYQRTR